MTEDTSKRKYYGKSASNCACLANPDSTGQQSAH